VKFISAKEKSDDNVASSQILHSRHRPAKSGGIGFPIAVEAKSPETHREMLSVQLKWKRVHPA